MVDPHIVLFFSPKCHHSQAFFKIWVEFISLRKLSTEVKSALVDCAAETSLCVTQNILAYPTIKFYHPNHLTRPVRFKGDRTVGRLKHFLFDMVAKAFEETNKGPESFPPPNHFRTVATLTDDNFEKITTHGSFFIKFYTSWCPVCQTFAPTWIELAQKMPDPSSYSIAEVNCDTALTSCTMHGVTEYPTLLWFHNGMMTRKFSGSLSLEGLQQFIDESLLTNDQFKHLTVGTVPEWVPPVPTIEVRSDIQFLTNVREVKLAFVKFYVPWCRYCKELAPKWMEMSQILARDHPGKVNVISVNCEVTKQLCLDLKVRGYPSVVLYRNGRSVEQYRGPRDTSAMVNYVVRYIVDNERQSKTEL